MTNSLNSVVRDRGIQREKVRDYEGKGGGDYEGKLERVNEKESRERRKERILTKLQVFMKEFTFKV